LQANTETFIKEAGGRVLGGARAPLGTTDFSAYLLQAKASGAKIIGLANAGTDLQNCIKQAHEFGIVAAGQRLATLLMMIPDVLALGQDTRRGLVLSNSFYCNQSDAARTWSDRYATTMNKPPTEYNAASYAAITHWLRAAQSANTLDADTVAAKMHELPVEDFYNKAVRILANGCVPNAMYLWEVKPEAESKRRWDVYNLLSTIPSPDAYPPVGMFGCPLAPA